MNDFRFKVPQVIEFGVGSLKKLPEILKESKSEHVFLISDHGLEHRRCEKGAGHHC